MLDIEINGNDKRNSNLFRPLIRIEVKVEGMGVFKSITVQLINVGAQLMSSQLSVLKVRAALFRGSQSIQFLLLIEIFEFKWSSNTLSGAYSLSMKLIRVISVVRFPTCFD